MWWVHSFTTLSSKLNEHKFIPYAMAQAVNSSASQCRGLGSIPRQSTWYLLKSGTGKGHACSISVFAWLSFHQCYILNYVIHNWRNFSIINIIKKHPPPHQKKRIMWERQHHSWLQTTADRESGQQCDYKHHLIRHSLFYYAAQTRTSLTIFWDNLLVPT